MGKESEFFVVASSRFFAGGLGSFTPVLCDRTRDGSSGILQTESLRGDGRVVSTASSVLDCRRRRIVHNLRHGEP